MKPVNKMTVLLSVALLLVAVWMVAPGRSPHVMPVYGGKTAEEWFFGSNHHPGLQTTMNDARVAFKAMGTNCVPFLLDKAKTRETTFNRFYGWLHPKLPTQVRRKLRPALRATYIQMIAYSHLRDVTLELSLALDESLKDEILAGVKTIEDDSTRLLAFQLAESLTTRMGDIEKKRAYFLSFLDDPDFEIQLQSAVALSHVDNKITNGLPILVRAATNESFVAQAITSRFSARTGVPTLHLQSMIRSKQKSAREALRSVSPVMADQLELSPYLPPD